MSEGSYNRVARIKAVEVEHTVMRFAADRLIEAAAFDPTVLKGAFRPRALQVASDWLEGTYVVRLFAEFETDLRSYWRTIKRTIPPTREPIDSLGGRCRIPYDETANVHRVRLWRNAIVHERDDEIERVPIDVARHYLCCYFAYLPPNW